MNIIFKSIRPSLTILFLFNLSLSACEDQVFEIINNEEVILTALRERSETKLSNSTRDFYSIFSDSSTFNIIYPGTNKSCGYILRYYFYTNIFIGSDQSILVSMDRSRFNILSEDNVISQTKSVIERIRNMSFGNEEYQEFINEYPNLK
ncbi:MAG: hypothetical protein ACKVKJ_06760 [Fidelibacterota bacterium]|jgi:hypothetical protein|tara:strand:+ start:80 stop:526 length:447 start_codon:yes stop_codon:yes gene_type:complete